MQKAYIATLYEIAAHDRRVISVLSDSGTEYDELFMRDLPDQCVNVGIAEENQVAMAAGLARAGKIPFVYTSGAFLAYRAYEFIRDDVCLQNRNVKVVGMGSGLSWSTLGPTHHTTEDFAVLRVLPNLTILSPATPKEAVQAIRDAVELEAPVYVRLGMGGEPEFYTGDVPSLLKESCVTIREGEDATVFCTGAILSEALSAAQTLEEQGISLRVVNVRRICPLENVELLSLINGNVTFTLEEHSTCGGLGGVVSEAIAAEGVGTRLVRIGLNGVFGHGYGTYNEVRKSNRLDAESVMRTVYEELS